MSRERQIVGHQEGLAPEIVFGQNRTVKARLFDDYSHFVYRHHQFLCPSFSPVTFAFGLLPMIDTELLLLRTAGFLLAFTFGIQKIGWYATAFHAGKPLSTIGLAPLIAHVGFPLPVILALWITLNESIGAFFIGIGFLTRFAAASLALGMIGALYTSVRLGEDWLRAALYFIIFLSLTLTGAGKFSIDRLLNKSE